MSDSIKRRWCGTLVPLLMATLLAVGCGTDVAGDAEDGGVRFKNKDWADDPETVHSAGQCDDVCPLGTVCEHNDEGVHCVDRECPGTFEVCNGLDDDCDGLTDEDFLDLNQNGVADCFEALNPPDPTKDVTEQKDATVVNPPKDSDMDQDPDDSDCAPQDPNVHHGATEICNGQDDNCDGAIDESFDDTDSDGEADCIDPDDDNDDIPDADDCDPTDPGIHPAAKEVCNGKDDNCDGVVDPEDAAGCIPFFKDGDNDGYGTNESKCLCAPADPFDAELKGDCKDADAAVHPDAEETCNGKDDDCDGQTDPATICQPAHKICLDPGDGGGNPGAVGIVTEKNVNLAMGLKARDWLQADTAKPGGGATWNVIMTRDSDVDVALADRVEYANSNGAERFVSIHNNSCGGCGGTGTETYKKPGAGGNASDLTGKVQSKMVAYLGLKDRGVKETDFYVLVNTSMPATITFGGFVDTQQDVNVINSADGKSKAGKAILHALQIHLGYGEYTP